jgi:carbonic anhydrase/acetyltransferase-like protein (isoleucine patch superfamily)
VGQETSALAAYAARYPGAIIRAVEGVVPEIDPEAWIAPGVVVAGQARIKAGASVWYGSVIRADNDLIEVGERANIQDGTLMHADHGFPLIVGPEVVVGHGVRLHSCKVEALCLIGIGSVLLNEVTVGTGSIIAAGAIVTPRKQIPAGQLWAGNPAAFLRDTRDTERAQIARAAEHYVHQSARHAGS